KGSNLCERRKETMMSEQSNQTEQSTMTSQELRQRILEELEASKQAIEELGDEELENIAGGTFAEAAAKVGKFIFHDKKNSVHDKTLQTTFGGGVAAAIGVGTFKALTGKQAAG